MRLINTLGLLALPLIALAQDDPPRNPCYVYEGGPSYCDEGLTTHWGPPNYPIDAFYGAQCERAEPASNATYTEQGGFASFRACLATCARLDECKAATYNRGSRSCRIYNGTVLVTGKLYDGLWDVIKRLPPGSCTQRSN